MNIVTVSREFGSGGRELARRLAEQLGYDYFDKEIVVEIAKRMGIDENYINSFLQGKISGGIAMHFGCSFLSYASLSGNTIQILLEQRKLIKEIATKGNCVIVGCAANILLEEFNPCNLFVYADEEQKIARCMEHSHKYGESNESEIKTKMKQIDEIRKKRQKIISGIEWGKKEGYHLCINTSNKKIKSIVPAIAEYVKIWMKNEAST